MSTPNLFSYLSYRAFLDDWFTAKKQANPRYSHRLFARRAGVRSPSLLHEVISGQRNLTSSTVEGFLAALELSHQEASFFVDLVQLDQGKTDAERNEALERVAASRRFRSARPLERGMVQYLSRWYYPAIRELALCRDFRAEPAWVAQRLQPRVTEAQARDALEVLMELGMLVPHGDTVRPAEVSVATPHEVAGLVAHNYHQQMLERASEAIGSVPPRERHLLGVTVAIPEDLVPQLKAELDRFQERLLHLCDARAEHAQRVYQLHLSLFPLSRPEGGP